MTVTSLVRVSTVGLDVHVGVTVIVYVSVSIVGATVMVLVRDTVSEPVVHDGVTVTV